MGSLVLFVDSAAFNTEDHEMLPGVGQGCDECPKPCPVCSQGAREASQSGCGGASRGEGEFPCLSAERVGTADLGPGVAVSGGERQGARGKGTQDVCVGRDRKSTRLNSSHVSISY